MLEYEYFSVAINQFVKGHRKAFNKKNRCFFICLFLLYKRF